MNEEKKNLESDEAIAKSDLSSKLYGGLPNRIKLFDVVYNITYVDKPSDVDIYKRNSLFGQVDYWTRTIRIYHNGRSEADIWQTLWHEIIHAICEKLKLEDLRKDEHATDLLATGINSIILDNLPAV